MLQASLIRQKHCAIRPHVPAGLGFRQGQAAKLIGVCNMTALRMLRRGDIKGRQACAGAPWVIRAEDLAGFAKGKRRKPPLTQNTTQQIFDFQ
jgi:hypothetical protein